MLKNDLAWAIWTSATQVMAKRKGKSQTGNFDSRPLKVGNRPDPGACRLNATHPWKALEESYNFALDFILIRGLSKEL